MHSAVEDFPLVQENTKGSKFWLSVMPALKPYLPVRLYELLEEEVSYQVDLENTPVYKALPNGAVHADLFRNNSLIEVNGTEEKLGGIIDFTSPAMPLSSTILLSYSMTGASIWKPAKSICLKHRRL